MTAAPEWTARFDDRGPAQRAWVFTGQCAAGEARDLDQVVVEVARAEREAAAGRWVAMTVSYEAAAAFEPAAPTRWAHQQSPVPLVAWASFAARRDAPPLPAAAGTAAAVVRHPPTGYPATVDTIRSRIAAGDVYQVNVTDRFTQADTTVDDLYAQMLATQSAEFGARLTAPWGGVACTSPELFFRWDGDTVTCRPMKGTRPRHPRAGADAARAAELAGSPKDRAENVMIVDLLRNDLGRIAHVGSVRVPELFTVERYETVWQMTSTVQADVPTTTSLVELFRALFPCGSVTGAPKISAMRIIAELETGPRGIYCGAIGYLAPAGTAPRAVFCVPIRTAFVDPAGNATYGAGAGITWSSDPAEEDAEVLTKARVLTDPWSDFELLETLRLDAAGIHHAAEHLDRLQASAAWFGIPFERATAASELERLAAQQPGRGAGAPVTAARRVRLLVSRDGTVRSETHPLDPAPGVVTLAVDTAVSRSDDVFCCHKTTRRAHYAAARERHPGCDDVVLVNERGNAVETTVANLAYRIDGAWYVPPLTDGGLAGIGRAIALAAGRVTERSIRATDLATCSGLAVINDLRGWRPAVLRPR